MKELLLNYFSAELLFSCCTAIPDCISPTNNFLLQMATQFYRSTKSRRMLNVYLHSNCNHYYSYAKSFLPHAGLTAFDLSIIQLSQLRIFRDEEFCDCYILLPIITNAYLRNYEEFLRDYVKPIISYNAYLPNYEEFLRD